MDRRSFLGVTAAVAGSLMLPKLTLAAPPSTPVPLASEAAVWMATYLGTALQERGVVCRTYTGTNEAYVPCCGFLLESDPEVWKTVETCMKQVNRDSEWVLRKIKELFGDKPLVFLKPKHVDYGHECDGVSVWSRQTHRGIELLTNIANTGELDNKKVFHRAVADWMTG